MVSYVLLIVIAAALSVVVYSYLRSQIPRGSVECPSDTSLIAESVSCDISTLRIQLTNRGLFNVSGVFLRFGVAGTTVKLQIPGNIGDELFKPPHYPLSPGESTARINYIINNFLVENVSDYELEIQPAIIRERRVIICEKALITQPITCSS